MPETFHGYIESTQDVLLVFEACRRGLLSRISRRLQESERRHISSGSIFVFDERESGIKRWTDGLFWSPSRIMGNFLVYRELDKKTTGDKRKESRQRSYSADQTCSTDRQHKERRLVGSLSDAYRFRKDGLIKKTMSVMINGSTQHLVSYYHPQDIVESKLRIPSSIPELASLEISKDLLVKQNFRVPPLVEQDTLVTQFDDKPVANYRSMSIGSVQPSQVMMSNLLYTPSRGIEYSKLSNTSFYPCHTGFSPLPSPSSLTSSPMLSPVHPSSRHPSISSSSGPMHRFAARNSFDFMSQDILLPNQEGPLLNPIHPLKPHHLDYSFERQDLMYRTDLVLPHYEPTPSDLAIASFKEI